VNALPTVSVTGANAICVGSSVVLTGTGASTYSWNTGPTTSTISVSPTVTTTYSVAGTGTNGCSNSSTKTVTVNPIPTINTSGSSSSICNGQNANLVANGASTYTWMPGALTGSSVTANPSSSTIYTVTGTSAGGCTNTAQTNVIVNPLPAVNATTSNSIICGAPYQGTTTLNASGASTYTWLPGSTSGNAISVSPSVTTTYSVIGTSTANCSNMAMITVSVSTCAGIQQVTNAGAYAIYPNPTSGKLTIEYQTSSATVIYAEVHDASGKLVMKQQLNYNTSDKEQTINISSLANGLYFIQLTNSENGTETVRIIKE
jgi:hypothetical protein